MSVVTTGRQRTLTVSGSVDGTFRFRGGVITRDPETNECNGGVAFISARGDMSASSPWGAGVSVASFIDNRDYGIIVTANDGVSSAAGSAWSHYSVLANVDHTQAYSGSYSMSVDVEECVEVIQSTWNGYEAPQITTVRIFERMRIGGSLSASVTSGGASASKTDTIGTAAEISSYTSSMAAAGSASNYPVTYSTSLLFQGGSVTMTALSLSDSQSKASFSCSAGAVSVTLNPDTFGPCGTAGPASGNASAAPCPVKAYSLSGIVRTPHGGYPTSVGLAIDRASDLTAAHVEAGGGTFTDSNSQDRHGGASGLASGGTAKTLAAVDKWSNLLIHARAGVSGDGDASSLLANGDDKRDVRVLFRCFAPFAAGSFYQATAVTVDGGTALINSGTPYTGNWTAVQNGSVAVLGGTLALIGTAGAGEMATFNRSFTNSGGAAFDGYRYLQLTWGNSNGSAGASHPTITLQGAGRSPYWMQNYGGGTMTVIGQQRIDLCSPNSETASSDTTDTRWPLPTSDGAYYGVTAVTGIQISGIQCPGTVFLKPIELMGNNSHLTTLGDFDNWILEQSSTIGEVTTDTYDRRFLLGITDGRQSCEIKDVQKIVVTGGGGAGTSYSQSSLAGMINELNGPGNPSLEPNKVHAGWAGTVTGGTTDGTTLTTWLNANRPATWLFGGYALWNGSASQWVYGSALNTYGTANTVAGSAQVLADTISWYPGCGDALQIGTSTGYGGTLLARAAYILRGAVHGLILSTAGTPYGGALVTAQDTTDSVGAGTAVTDTQGWYKTETPWAKGLHSINVSGSADAAVFPTATITAKNRHISRVVLKPTTSDRWIAIDISDAGRFVRVFESGGALKMGAATNWTATTWDDRTMGVNGTRPCVRFYRADTEQRAYVAYESTDGGPVVVGYTPDEGRSWVPVMNLFTTGKMVRSCITRDGRKWFYVQESGDIKGICLDGQDNILIAGTTVISGGVDDDAIDCQEFKGAAGSWKMRVVYRSGGTVVDKTSLDGTNFT